MRGLTADRLANSLSLFISKICVLRSGVKWCKMLNNGTVLVKDKKANYKKVVQWWDNGTVLGNKKAGGIMVQWWVLVNLGIYQWDGAGRV